MTFFDDLGDSESIFKNEDALDLDWVPKLMPFREQQQFHVANCIKPLLQSRNGRNLFIFGAPGVGKTSATKWVLRDLEETSEDTYIIYINCWQKNTTYKIIVEICYQLGYRFTQNKNTEELFEIIKNMVNKKAAVFVFDEIDKMEDFDFLYSILNDIYKKSVLLITNYKSFLDDLEERIKSRLMPEIVEFQNYNKEETKAILKQRCEFAFHDNIWDDQAFSLIVEKSSELKDIRSGLFLLRESGLVAEELNSRKIKIEHANKAIQKVKDFTIKNPDELEEDTKIILEIVKTNTGQRIGDLFKIYKEKGGTGIYKTFQRRIERLEKGKFITTNKIQGGKEGNTTIINYEKKLTEF